MLYCILLLLYIIRSWSIFSYSPPSHSNIPLIQSNTPLIYLPITILLLSFSFPCSSHSQISKNILTPHKLSEWMVEVCRFEVYPYQVERLTLGVYVYITYILYYTHTYTYTYLYYIIPYTILFYSSFQSSLLLYLSISQDKPLQIYISSLTSRIHSIRVGVYSWILISPPIPNSSDNLQWSGISSLKNETTNQHGDIRDIFFWICLLIQYF